MKPIVPIHLGTVQMFRHCAYTTSSERGVGGGHS